MKPVQADNDLSDQRYRFLADSVPQIVWTAKPDGNLDYYNQRWFDYAGVDLEAMERLGWTFFVHPEDLPDAAKAWQKSIETSCSYEVEFRLKRASDETYRWHLVRAFGMKDEMGAVIQWVGTCTDIDDQLRANEVLENLVTERTAKLLGMVEELETFSYSISHDLRAPLRAMMGFSKVLKEDHSTQLDEEGQRYLDRITTASHRMDELIQDVLNLSKVSRTDLLLAPVDPGTLIIEIATTYPNLGSSEIALSLAQVFPLVMVNQSAFTQCISNLLSNAVKFVAPGVKPHVDVWADSKDGKVRLWFKDNGIGIAPENSQKIFDIFQRVDEDHEGTGIGLSIVKKAVERMGGSVGLESELGQGTSFWLELQGAVSTGT